MKYSLRVCYVFIVYNITHLISDIVPYITGGSYAEYEQYPHSALLLNFCIGRATCGGSVLNQNIVLTAAHCLETCLKKTTYKLFIKYGNKKIKHMNWTLMKKFTIHPEYDENELTNDLGIILTENVIPLKTVKRIILMRSPPRVKDASVAGWGFDENLQEQSSLKHVDTLVQSSQVCLRMGWLPAGVFCAGPISGYGAASIGDSGSALVINNYIQIGIVSFREADYSLVAYTNVSYHLDWIHESAKNIFCENETCSNEEHC